MAPANEKSFYILGGRWGLEEGISGFRAVRSRVSKGGWLADIGYSTTMTCYTPYESPNLANQKRRKLGVFGRKLEESNYPFIDFFWDKY